ncbi:MAG: AmmeMemoRadiSam system protein B [Chloroflexi bacterium]|nr:AmmeMemoRadiSam system protein B [Chloroflexota bacterium]
MVSLQDPLRLGGDGILVPQAVAPLLALCDGTRSLDDLRTGYLLRTGVTLSPDQVGSLIHALDEACMLDNHRYNQALGQAMETYRSGPYRSPALAGGGYPRDPGQLQETMDDYFRRAGDIDGSGAQRDASGVQGAGFEEQSDGARFVGLITPHIDYHRGWRTYAEVWGRMAHAVEAAELIILLGTDHAGHPGSISLTKQSYATPWGKLPTDPDLVERLADILGEDQAFSQEAHHIGEHSIELASVWLHHVNGGKPKTVLPVLCGGPEPYIQATNGESKNGLAAKVWRVVELLKGVVASRPALVVAAADLSHVGPTFGDPAPIDAAGKGRVRASDQKWLEAACSGNSDTLRDHILEHGDPTRICGAAPVYLMAAILGDARGRVVHYDQCPADDDFGSLVSIAGVVYSR